MKCKWCDVEIDGQDAGDDFPDLAVLCLHCSAQKEALEKRNRWTYEYWPSYKNAKQINILYADKIIAVADPDKGPEVSSLVSLANLGKEK